MDSRTVPCLLRLTYEFDQMAPDRDHASDGSVGDKRHQQEVSDHNPDETGAVPIHDADKTNEIHAIDIDTDFRVPGLTMEVVVQFLLGRCRSGAEKRLRYIIYNRRIWSASNDWKQRTYSGSSPHTEHAHFSASYVSSLEASTASWHLEDIPVALTAADKAWIASAIAAEVAKVAGQTWAYKFNRPNGPDGNGNTQTTAGAYQCWNDVINKDTADAAAEHVIEVLGPKIDALASKG